MVMIMNERNTFTVGSHSGARSVNKEAERSRLCFISVEIRFDDDKSLSGGGRLS